MAGPSVSSNQQQCSEEVRAQLAAGAGRHPAFTAWLCVEEENHMRVLPGARSCLESQLGARQQHAAKLTKKFGLCRVIASAPHI